MKTIQSQAEKILKSEFTAQSDLAAGAICELLDLHQTNPLNAGAVSVMLRFLNRLNDDQRIRVFTLVGAEKFNSHPTEFLNAMSIEEWFAFNGFTTKYAAKNI